MRFLVAEHREDFHTLSPQAGEGDVMVPLTDDALQGVPPDWPGDRVMRREALVEQELAACPAAATTLLDQMAGPAAGELQQLLDEICERRTLVEALARLEGPKSFVGGNEAVASSGRPSSVRYGAMMMAGRPNFVAVGGAGRIVSRDRRYPELAALRAVLKARGIMAAEPGDGGSPDMGPMLPGRMPLWFGTWPRIECLPHWPAAPENRDPPTLGVVVPAHNAAASIGRTVGAILAGLSPRDQLIIVENGSTDSTWNILRASWSDDPRVVLETLNEPDAAQARSRGVSLCRAEYVAFCDADDLWASCKPAVVRDVLARTDADMLMHTVLTIVDGMPDVIEARLIVEGRAKTETLLGDLLLGANFVVTSAFVVRRALFRDPAFSVGLRHAQDYDAWCRLAVDNPHATFAYVDTPLGFYRHWGGLSHAVGRRIVNVSGIARVYSRHLPFWLRIRVLLRNAARTAWYAIRQDHPAALMWQALVGRPHPAIGAGQR